MNGPRNDDWIKTGSWDVWLDGRLVSTLDQLIDALELRDVRAGTRRAYLRHFLSLPAAAAMPEDLRRAVEANT